MVIETSKNENNNHSDKVGISNKEGIMTFPGFPVVLVCIQKNILTVAAVSFFSFDPPMVMIGIVPTRYSFELIKNSQDFSINIPKQDQLEAVLICGSKSGRDVNKFEAAGLTPKKSLKIASYLIDECPVNLECKIVHTLDLQGSHTWFIGEIVAAQKTKDYDRSHALMFWPREFRKVGEVIKSKVSS